MKNILIAVDGFHHAQAALGWARELAKSAREPVFHLVHSYWVPMMPAEGSAYYPVALQQAEDEGRKLLEQSAAALSGAQVRTHLVEGVPGAAILGVAQKVGTDLIAVGSRGLGRAASLLLGSVSTEVVHQAGVPVLVARDGQPRPVRRVLVGVDGSQHSARALKFAAAVAPEGDVVAMHVVHLSPEAYHLFAQADVSLDVAVERTARDVVSSTAELAGVAPERVTPMSAAGQTAECLLNECKTGDYDLLVVGSRGLSVIGELFLGSVSERVLRLAHNPVVVVK